MIVYMNVEHLDISFLYINYLIKIKDWMLMCGLKETLTLIFQRLILLIVYKIKVYKENPSL